jgi:hypothetical protein
MYKKCIFFCFVFTGVPIFVFYNHNPKPLSIQLYYHMITQDYSLNKLFEIHRNSSFHLFNNQLICLSFLLIMLFISCSPKEKTLEQVLLEYNFYQESPLSESDEYSFQAGTFKLNKKNKRSGEVRSFTGKYSTKKGKYSDTGESYSYLKLIFDDTNYASTKFFVYDNGVLTEPFKDKKSVKSEDAYGLDTESWTVSLAPNYATYSPIKK